MLEAPRGGASDKLEWLPIPPEARLHGNRVGEGAVGEAAFPGDLHQARDLVLGFVRFDVDLYLDAEAQGGCQALRQAM